MCASDYAKLHVSQKQYKSMLSAPYSPVTYELAPATA
jgi:hypothetical protein